eukprot:comp22487_c1_seq1/m.33923 comp22487_c1_seq1/g.33923  ORF comp22487_c1_seq1/g.33923 comp22487_c1_seq1/m.33923 type:complete len:195 (-) comp22487_c1_seq1:586-1170(-)
MPPAVTRRKVIVVGDGAVGKTNLIIMFVKGQWPDVYTPTVFEASVTEMQVDGKPVELTIWDTAGQEDYDRLRPLSYPKSSVIMICFSVEDPDSYYNVAEKWAVEAKHHCPNVPIVLVGTKIDLRNNADTEAKLKKDGEKCVTKEQGETMAVQIGACKYVECSAKLSQGLKEVFDTVARAALNYKPPKKSGCSLL